MQRHLHIFKIRVKHCTFNIQLQKALQVVDHQPFSWASFVSMEKISTCLLLFPLLIHENSFAEHSGKSSNQREVASSRVRPQIELHSRLFVSNGDCSMTIVRDPKASFYEGKKWRDACLFSRNWTTATGTTWPLWPACSNFLPLKLNEEVHTSRQLVRKLKFLATIWHYHVCWGYANFAKICSLLYLLLLKIIYIVLNLFWQAIVFQTTLLQL